MFSCAQLCSNILAVINGLGRVRRLLSDDCQLLNFAPTYSNGLEKLLWTTVCHEVCGSTLINPYSFAYFRARLWPNCSFIIGGSTRRSQLNYFKRNLVFVSKCKSKQLEQQTGSIFISIDVSWFIMQFQNTQTDIYACLNVLFFNTAIQF